MRRDAPLQLVLLTSTFAESFGHNSDLGYVFAEGNHVSVTMRVHGEFSLLPSFLFSPFFRMAALRLGNGSAVATCR